MLSCCCRSRTARNEDEGKVHSVSEKVRPYDDVSTLPSYWSPPKDYNESASSVHSNEVTYHQQQSPHSSLNSANNEEFSSLDSYADSSRDDSLSYQHRDSSQNSSRDYRQSSQSLPRKPRGDDPHSDNRHVTGTQEITNVHQQQRTTVEPSSSSSSVQMRRILESNKKYETGSGSLKRSSCEIKLQQKHETNLKRSSVEADRELRLQEWEKKRTDRLSDEILIHNIRAPESAFTKEKKCTDEIIWVKRENFNDSKTTLERKRHSYHEKEDRYSKDEDYDTKKRELADLASKEQEVKRLKMAEELDRVKQEEKARIIERQRREDLEKKRTEEELERNLKGEILERKLEEEKERKLKEEELVRKRKEMELERKRRDEEMERRQKEELERKLKEVELDRRRMAEELEIQRREEQLERKQREQELERKRKEELERKRREEEKQRQLEEEEESKLKEDEDRESKLKEEESERRREEEEREQRLEEEEREQRLEEEERERRLEEEKRERRLEEEERERILKEETERERILKEEKERERILKDEKERERIFKEDEERERILMEEEERERILKEDEEIEMILKEDEERERILKDDEERERILKDDEERERILKDDEERERILKEQEEERESKLKEDDEERERKLKEDDEEREIKLKEEEERERILKEEEERERVFKEEEERERVFKEEEERERIFKVDEERERILKEEEEERERILKEDRILKEEGEKEIKLQEEQEHKEELHRKQEEEIRRLKGEEELERKVDEAKLIKSPQKKNDEIINKNSSISKYEFEEEERIRKEKDLIEIEKTKKRIAELKKERDLIQRKQAFRMQMLLKGEDPDKQLSDSDSEELHDSLLNTNVCITIEPPSSPHRTAESLDDEVPIHATEEIISPEEKQHDGIAALDALVSSVQVNTTQDDDDDEDKDYDSVECDRDSLEDGTDLQVDKSSEEVYYDTTVTSAQHKIDEFCTSPLSGSPALRNGRNNSYYSQHNTSTVSSDFEPLPPPIPPHSVNPATLVQNDQSPEPKTQRPTQLGSLDENRKYTDSSGPEIMTPEEEQKLLSHKGSNSILTDAEATEVSKILSHDNDKIDGGSRSTDQDHSFESKQLPEPPSVEPTTTTTEDEVFGVPVGQTTEEGFVMRTKEVHYEDGIHYFEDGHFWIEVPGLQEDEDDDLPEDVPVHKHTKIKFSTGPIQLFSTFSVNDYDRKNDEVDPVAASAEYELEKRVEKMDVFPVQIDKGEGGLGLSIIGMGVGADAGVEKLGIFVKTITPGGSTNLDGRIKVNDQIIEVDSQSLVGVTQMYAASVLKNTTGTVNFLIGREQDPDNSEVAMLIRQSLMADLEREDRRRALGGPNYDQENVEMFESFSSPSGGDSDENSRNNVSQYEETPEQPVIYNGNFNNQFSDSYGSSGGPISSSSVESFNRVAADTDLLVLTQHVQDVQQRNQMYEEEITMLRSKINGLEREISEKCDLSTNLHDMTSKVTDIEGLLESKEKNYSNLQQVLEQSQGHFNVLEKKYYKAKKIIKEYQSRERDFLHREEYHITQIDEKDEHYNSLVKALKDRVIQLEADLVKAQQTAGLPIKLPPDLNSQSSTFVSINSSILSDTQKEPPRKPTVLDALDPDLSDTEGCETLTSEDSKASTVERKMGSKEEDLDFAFPPHELLDVSFSRAKGELALRGGLAKRQLPSLKKTASTSSASSFDRSLDDSVDEALLPESPTKRSPPPSESFGRPQQSYQPHHSQQQPPSSSATHHANSPPHSNSPHHYGPHLPSQPPPYQPPPSAPLAGQRPMGSADSTRSDAPYRHQPPIARVQPVNRMEVTKSPTSPPARTPQQQSLAHQLKTILAERDLSSEHSSSSPSSSAPQSPVKKSASMLMEDVRQAVLQANISIGKKPMISGPIHVSSTAQVVSTGHFVNNRTASPVKNVGSSSHQRLSRDSGSWSPNLTKSSHHSSSSVVAPSHSPGVVLLSQKPIDTSLPPLLHTNEDSFRNPMEMKESCSRGSLDDLDFDSPSDRSKSSRYSREPISVFDWTKEQVAQWLVGQGLEGHVTKFISAGITGPRLVNIDTKDLKTMGLTSDEKNKIKRKVKELRQNLEKERKQIEREKKEKEKLQKKAEKLAEKAEKKRK